MACSSSVSHNELSILCFIHVSQSARSRDILDRLLVAQLVRNNDTLITERTVRWATNSWNLPCLSLVPFATKSEIVFVNYYILVLGMPYVCFSWCQLITTSLTVQPIPVKCGTFPHHPPWSFGIAVIVLQVQVLSPCFWCIAFFKLSVIFVGWSKTTVICVFSYFYPKSPGSSLALRKIEQSTISISVLGFFWWSFMAVRYSNSLNYVILDLRNSTARKFVPVGANLRQSWKRILHP